MWNGERMVPENSKSVWVIEMNGELGRLLGNQLCRPQAPSNGTSEKKDPENIFFSFSFFLSFFFSFFFFLSLWFVSHVIGIGLIATFMPMISVGDGPMAALLLNSNPKMANGRRRVVYRLLIYSTGWFILPLWCVSFFFFFKSGIPR